mgnify:FL=1
MRNRAMKQKLSSELKSKVVLEALRQEKTLTEIASTYSINPSQITEWKKTGVEHLKLAFSPKKNDELKDLKNLT